MSFRLTKKRSLILTALQSAEGSLSAAELHRRVPQVDLTTIYRTLEVLTDAGLISKLHLTSNEAEYEYQRTPHHHAVCSNCDRVLHFTAPDTKIKKLLTLHGFSIDAVEVTVRGTCTKHHT